MSQLATIFQQKLEAKLGGGGLNCDCTDQLAKYALAASVGQSNTELLKEKSTQLYEFLLEQNKTLETTAQAKYIEYVPNGSDVTLRKQYHQQWSAARKTVLELGLVNENGFATLMKQALSEAQIEHKSVTGNDRGTSSPRLPS